MPGKSRGVIMRVFWGGEVYRKRHIRVVWKKGVSRKEFLHRRASKKEGNDKKSFSRGKGAILGGWGDLYLPETGIQ